MASPLLVGRVKPQSLGLLSAALPSPMGDAVGLLADAAGYAEDPRSLTLGSGLLSVAGLVPGIPAPAALKAGLKGDAGFMYHATNADRLKEIAEAGSLNVHKPWDFTDQDMWPDGAIEPRAYFGHSPEHLWSFAPESGMPVVLRVKQNAAKFARESTGDWFTRKPIPSSLIEFLAEDGRWHSLKPPLVK